MITGRTRLLLNCSSPDEANQLASALRELRTARINFIESGYPKEWEYPPDVQGSTLQISREEYLPTELWRILEDVSIASSSSLPIPLPCLQILRSFLKAFDQAQIVTVTGIEQELSLDERSLEARRHRELVNFLKLVDENIVSQPVSVISIFGTSEAMTVTGPKGEIHLTFAQQRTLLVLAMLGAGRKSFCVTAFCEKYYGKKPYDASAQFDTPIRELKKKISALAWRRAGKGHRQLSGILIQSTLSQSDSMKLLEALRG